MEYHPVVTKIITLLKDHTVWFETFEHEPVSTSEEAAKIRPGYTLEQGAKAMIVKTKKRGGGSEFVMLVFPAHLRFDSKKVKKGLDVTDLRFATADEATKITSGVEFGAVPPFGTLFNLNIYVDPKLFLNEKIVFNAGDKRFSVAMLSKDYQKLVPIKELEIT